MLELMAAEAADASGREDRLRAVRTDLGSGLLRLPPGIGRDDAVLHVVPGRPLAGVLDSRLTECEAEVRVLSVLPDCLHEDPTLVGLICDRPPGVGEGCLGGFSLAQGLGVARANRTGPGIGPRDIRYFRVVPRWTPA